MLIFAVPVLLAAAFIIPVLSLRAKRLVGIFAVSAVALAFGIVVFSASGILSGNIFVWQMASWQPPIGIVIASDSFSLLIAGMVTGLGLAVAVFSLRYIKVRVAEFYTLLLLMLAGMYGFSITGDLFNMYVFFEIMSVSSYALTAWFRTKFALEAAIKYLIMGALSTSLVLLGILLMYGLTGTLTLADIAAKQPSGVAFSTALALIITGFSVKAAVVPFHFWKPDAAEGAVEPVAAVFCGLSAAIGFYGFTRLLFVFGLIQLSWMLIALGIITMVGGALFALVQNNIKRLLAYSTISQFGYVFIALGLGPQGLPAALFHVLNNGLIKVLLFLTVGIVVYHAGTRHISELGGMGKTIPVTAFCFGIGALALAGVPGLNGFASKYLIYLASWNVSPALVVVELVVSGLTLAYYLRVFSCVFLGPEKHGPKGASMRIPKLMIIPTVILALLCIVLGIFPQLAMYIIEPAAASLLNLPNYISVVLGT